MNVLLRNSISHLYRIAKVYTVIALIGASLVVLFEVLKLQDKPNDGSSVEFQYLAIKIVVLATCALVGFRLLTYKLHEFIVVYRQLRSKPKDLKSNSDAVRKTVSPDISHLR